MANFKSRNLMQSDFSLSLLWLFDLLNFEVPNLEFIIRLLSNLRSG